MLERCCVQYTNHSAVRMSADYIYCAVAAGVLSWVMTWSVALTVLLTRPSVVWTRQQEEQRVLCMQQREQWSRSLSNHTHVQLTN